MENPQNVKLNILFNIDGEILLTYNVNILTPRNMNTLQAVFKKLLHSNSYNQALSVETQTKSQAPSSTTTLQLTPARQPRKGSKLNSSNHNFLPLTNLPGIGRHTPSALKRYGITSIQQFAQFEEQEIIALLGRSGVQLLTTAKKICQTQFA